MGDRERRAWRLAVAAAIGAFLLLLLFNVAARDEPLRDAWLFPAGWAATTFLIKAYFIRQERRDRTRSDD
jgi:hypothetical protein